MNHCFSATLLLVACLNGLCAAEEPSKRSPPYYCPVEIVDEYPGERYLYLCDYFDPNCGTYLGYNFFLGNLSVVPYVNCPGDCAGSYKLAEVKTADVAAANVAPANVAPAKVTAANVAAAKQPRFEGRPGRVPLDYMHEPPVPRPNPAPAGTPGPFKGGGVNKERNAHFIKFMRNGRETFAKVIELRIRRSRPGVDADPPWESKFVAFEVDSNPADSGYPVHTVINPRQVDDRSQFAWKGRIMLDLGKSAEVLIFLAAEQAEKKNDQ